MAEYVIAEYKCLKCGCEYDREKPEVTACPLCGHFYVQWVNYEKWREWTNKKKRAKGEMEI